MPVSKMVDSKTLFKCSLSAIAAAYKNVVIMVICLYDDITCRFGKVLLFKTQYKNKKLFNSSPPKTFVIFHYLATPFL